MHIITNGFQSVQAGKIKNANLEKYFKTITNSESAGVKKPNPMIFHYAINSAKTTVEKSVMIGDSIEADIEGALNVGLDAIFFNEFKVEVNQHIHQIFDLQSLKYYL